MPVLSLSTMKVIALDYTDSTFGLCCCLLRVQISVLCGQTADNSGFRALLLFKLLLGEVENTLQRPQRQTSLPSETLLQDRWNLVTQKQSLFAVVCWLVLMV